MQLLTSSVLNDKRLFEINNESFKIILENLWNFLFRTITTHVRARGRQADHCASSDGNELEEKLNFCGVFLMQIFISIIKNSGI